MEIFGGLGGRRIGNTMMNRYVVALLPEFAPCFFGAQRATGNSGPAAARIGSGGRPGHPMGARVFPIHSRARVVYSAGGAPAPDVVVATAGRRSAVTTSATPSTTTAPPTRIVVVTCSLRINQPRNTATAGFTYA
jgi:hypothetical protein